MLKKGVWGAVRIYTCPIHKHRENIYKITTGYERDLRAVGFHRKALARFRYTSGGISFGVSRLGFKSLFAISCFEASGKSLTLPEPQFPLL